MITLAWCNYAQNITFIQDSLLPDYIENGHPDQRFINVVGHLENDLYNGYCEIYEVMFENIFLTNGNDITASQGDVLIYGKGTMINGIKEGKWMYFLIEHQTLEKFPLKESFYKKGFKEGEFIYFLPNGRKVSNGFYVSNQLEGTVTYYNQYGVVLSTAEFKHNLSNGPEIAYYPDGNIQMEKNFTDGIIDGAFKKYYPTGKIEEYQEFKMGKLDGIYRYYYNTGTLWVEKEYRNGLLWNITGNYNINGEPNDKGSLSNGEGTENYYTLEGLLYAVRTYKNGKMIHQEMKK